jgi:dihydropyrimidinase
MNEVLIKGGTIVNSQTAFKGDLYVRNGKIVSIGSSLGVTGAKVIDADGKLVLPGIIDAHVQLECAYKDTVMTDDFNTGTEAAAAGGVTTIVDFADQSAGKSPLEELDERMAIANSKVNVDYTLHLGVTNIEGSQVNELKQAVNERGINSFKLYMAYRKRGRLVDEGQIFGIMREAAAAGAICGVHAENEPLIDYLVSLYDETKGDFSVEHFANSRPPLAEELSIMIAAKIASATGATLYVHHLSTAAGLNVIRQARKEGQTIYAETCPQYLLLNEEVYKGDDGCLYVMNPPIRKQEDAEALWCALAADEIQVVGTDHCSYDIRQKTRNKHDFRMVPAGIPGIETLLPLLYSEGVCKGKINLQQLIQILSTKPAQIFDLYGRKGDLQVGFDADVVIFDPQRKGALVPSELKMNVDFSPFEHLEITGRVETTILRGEIIYTDGNWCGPQNYGRFVPTKAFIERGK